MYQEIFKQGKIGNITLKNRLVMSPMGTSLAEMDGSPSEDMIAFYKARAIGGAALIIPEIARVNDLHGAGMMRQLSVSKDRHIEGLAKLAETVHKYGTKIFIQLHHPGRETVTALTGGPVVSASAIPCKYLQQETRALSTEEVKALIQQFISGAVRVKKAGCDGVELHAAHGYGALLQNLCEYNYHSWEPGFAAIKLQSSIDDPWGELPIRTVIGGAYSSNDLMVHKLNLCEEIDADVLAPYLLTARYDRTAFMETGRR